MPRRRDNASQTPSLVEQVLDEQSLLVELLTTATNLVKAERAALLTCRRGNWSLEAAVGLGDQAQKFIKLLSGEDIIVRKERLERKLAQAVGAKNAALLVAATEPEMLTVMYIDRKQSSKPFSQKERTSLDFFPALAYRLLEQVQRYQVSMKDMLVDKSTAELERERILLALQRTRWSIKDAVEILGIPRRTLYYKMARLRIKGPRAMKALLAAR